MKKLTLAMLLALIGATAMAQNFEGKTLEERIAFSTGDNEDTRWLTYVILLVLILTAGVFGADQFIYANF